MEGIVSHGRHCHCTADWSAPSGDKGQASSHIGEEGIHGS